MGHASSGIFGYSHLTGGFAGGQAEYARVPFADVGRSRSRTSAGRAGALSFRHLPTGYMGAEMCDIKPGDVVAVWGAGPVGLLAMASAFAGGEEVVAIDRFDYWLAMAREARREPAQLRGRRRPATLKDLTGGRGPDACIDAVGMEAHSGMDFRCSSTTGSSRPRLETDRGPALRQRSWPAGKEAPSRSWGSTEDYRQVAGWSDG